MISGIGDHVFTEKTHCQHCVTIVDTGLPGPEIHTNMGRVPGGSGCFLGSWPPSVGAADRHPLGSHSVGGVLVPNTVSETEANLGPVL